MLEPARASQRRALLEQIHTLYDADDEVTRVVWDHVQDSIGHEAQSYGFDEMGRLTNFSQGDWDGTQFRSLRTSHGWRLDELANWREHKDQDIDPNAWLTVDVDGSNNAYAHWPSDVNHEGTQGRERTYDDVLKFLWRSETPTGAAVVQYVHDGLGRLVRVERVKDGTTTVLVTFGYDAAGRLAWKQATGQTRTWFVWDGAQTLQEIVVGATPPVQKEYLWAGGRLVAATDAAGLRTHLHQDRLGSNVLATHASGGSVVVDGRAYYDPYGRSVPSRYANDLPEPYGFAGARWEAFDADGTNGIQPGEGLYLMGARWYDPTMGRFVEQDPIGESGGLNLYAYVGSSPTQWVDPTGLSWWPLSDSRGGGPSSAWSRALSNAHRNSWDSQAAEETFARSRDIATIRQEFDESNEGLAAQEKADDEAKRKEAEEAAKATAQGTQGDPPQDAVSNILAKLGAAIAAALNAPYPVAGTQVPGIDTNVVNPGDRVLIVVGMEQGSATAGGKEISKTPLRDNMTTLGMRLEAMYPDEKVKVDVWNQPQDFIGRWNSQPAGSINHAYVLAHSEKGVMHMAEGADLTPRDLARMRGDVMAPGGNFVWAGCFTGAIGTESDFLSSSEFNSRGWTWGVNDYVYFLSKPPQAYAFPPGAGLKLSNWMVQPPKIF